MTQVDPTSTSRLDVRVEDERPARFGAVLVVAVVVLVAALFALPQPTLSWPLGLLVLVVVVVGGGAAIGAAAAVVLRTAARRPDPVPGRGAIGYVVASGLCFVTLCVVAPGAWLIALNWWNGWQGLDERGVAMTAVVAAALALAAVLALGGLAVLASRSVRLRLAWAKVDLAVQVWALGAVLASIAILY